jgi:hypothetical protein
MRITELVAWGFGVQDTEIPDVDDKGQPVPNGNGQPKMKPGKMLVLIDPQNGEQIRVRLSDEARRALVEQLSGGVLIPPLTVVKH